MFFWIFKFLRLWSHLCTLINLFIRLQHVQMEWLNFGTVTVSCTLKETKELSVKILENLDPVCHDSVQCLSCSVTCKTSVQWLLETITLSGWAHQSQRWWWPQLKVLLSNHTFQGRLSDFILFYYGWSKSLYCIHGTSVFILLEDCKRWSHILSVFVLLRFFVAY